MGTESVKETVRLSSHEAAACAYCTEAPGETFDARINHLIGAHGFRVLYIGSESSGGNASEVSIATVAILGSDEPPARVVRPAAPFIPRMPDPLGLGRGPRPILPNR